MSQWLRAEAQGKPMGVDRKTGAGVIRGYIMAEEGPFKSGRGEFTKDSLRKIVELCNERANGLKCRMGHPTSSDDGLGKYLGRVHSAWYEEYPSKGPIGDPLLQLGRVRGDLFFSETAHDIPGKGDLADYFMRRVEEDPDSLASSLVLDTEQEYRIDTDGRRKKGKDGQELPPVWMPIRLHASDLVDDGDAVQGGLLDSGEGSILSHEIVTQGCRLLDEQLGGHDEAFVREHVQRWLDRYCRLRFHADDDEEQRPPTEGEETLQILWQKRLEINRMAEQAAEL